MKKKSGCKCNQTLKKSQKDMKMLVNGQDMEYFTSFVQNFNPESLTEGLSTGFLFNLVMINLCFTLREHPNPRKFISDIMRMWEKSIKGGFEPKVKKHEEMMRTELGSCLNEKVYDSEAMRVILNSIIKQVLCRYETPLMNMVKDIEEDRKKNGGV